jgi:hypothetical protein
MSRHNRTKVTPVAGTPQQVNCQEADLVEVHISGLSGGDSIAVTRSLSEDADYVSWPLLDGEYNPVTSFTAAGIYTTEGGAWLKFTKTGTAGTTTTVFVRMQSD